jgi:hypothetical protein
MASQRAADVAPHLTGPAYGVAVLFVLLPFVDTLAQVWPVGLGNPSWRYGAAGIGANYLVSEVFGVWLLCFIAAARLHRRTLRVLTVLSAVAAVIALLTAAALALDALELRPTVPRDNPRNLFMFDVGVTKAMFKYAVAALIMGWIALSSRRAWRAMPAHGADGTPTLVRGQVTA